MISRTVLDNGISIISEEIGHVRSVSIGVWVRCGSCYEDSNTNGTSHFIEHMLFKGTEKRSAYDIAWTIDSIGGHMNAFTGKELTSFYLKIPDYHLPLAIDVLADVFKNSRFDKDEIAREKSVILQEIDMLEDSPDEYIHDFFEAAFWNSHPLGLPILGTKDRVKKMSRTALSRFFKSRYRGGNLILTAAGNLKHHNLVDLVHNAFGALSGDVEDEGIGVPVISPRVAVLEKNLEQVQMVIGVPAPSAISPRRHACMLLNAILGGSMSSRLFQEIREKRGLVYDVQSYLVPYTDVGLLGVYAGMPPKSVSEVASLILDAFLNLTRELLDDREIGGAKEFIKGSFLLSMESTDNRMTRLARNEVYFKRNVPPEEFVFHLDAVSGEDIRSLACELFAPANISLAVIGKVKEQKINRILHQ
jgi:predicted Zn-dependent peptidase